MIKLIISNIPKLLLGVLRIKYLGSQSFLVKCQINTYMEKKKILEMYYDFMENGIPGENGLCQHFERRYPNWRRVVPNDDERYELKELGLDSVWWGNNTMNYLERGEMTPLRQNIVLLMAAMSGEL